MTKKYTNNNRAKFDSVSINLQTGQLSNVLNIHLAADVQPVKALIKSNDQSKADIEVSGVYNPLDGSIAWTAPADTHGQTLPTLPTDATGLAGAFSGAGYQDLSQGHHPTFNQGAITHPTGNYDLILTPVVKKNLSIIYTPVGDNGVAGTPQTVQVGFVNVINTDTSLNGKNYVMDEHTDWTQLNTLKLHDGAGALTAGQSGHLVDGETLKQLGDQDAKLQLSPLVDPTTGTVTVSATGDEFVSVTNTAAATATNGDKLVINVAENEFHGFHTNSLAETNAKQTTESTDVASTDGQLVILKDGSGYNAYMLKDDGTKVPMTSVSDLQGKLRDLLAKAHGVSASSTGNDLHLYNFINTLSITKDASGSIQVTPAGTGASEALYEIGTGHRDTFGGSGFFIPIVAKDNANLQSKVNVDVSAITNKDGSETTFHVLQDGQLTFNTQTNKWQSGTGSTPSPIDLTASIGGSNVKVGTLTLDGSNVKITTDGSWTPNGFTPVAGQANTFEKIESAFAGTSVPLAPVSALSETGESTKQTFNVNQNLKTEAPDGSFTTIQGQSSSFKHDEFSGKNTHLDTNPFASDTLPKDNSIKWQTGMDKHIAETHGEVSLTASSVSATEAAALTKLNPTVSGDTYTFNLVQKAAGVSGGVAQTNNATGTGTTAVGTGTDQIATNGMHNVEVNLLDGSNNLYKGHIIQDPVSGNYELVDSSGKVLAYSHGAVTDTFAGNAGNGLTNQMKFTLVGEDANKYKVMSVDGDAQTGSNIASNGDASALVL